MSWTIPPPDPAYITVATVLVAIGMTVSGLEQLAERRQFSHVGAYSWPVLRTLNSWTLAGRGSVVFDRLFEYPQTLAIFALQVVLGVATGVAALTIGVEAGRFVLALLVGCLLASHLAGILRCQIGLDGADQMRTLVLAGLFVFLTAPGPWLQAAALWFIAAQAVCAYLTSGIAKLISPTWRGGSAVAAIVNAESYGDRRLAHLLLDCRWLSVTASRGTILLECVGPLLVLGGPRLCLLFIVAAILFHLAIAVAMGLNDFLWSFTASLPALLYVSHSVPWT
jgi:hypothetical protein